MFSYYGSKQALAHRYADPEHDLIIEPFAGSASYSLHGERWRNQVLLLEQDKRLAEVWQWLVDDATPDSVRSLPELKVGERSSEFLAIVGVALPGFHRLDSLEVSSHMAAQWRESRARMADEVRKVKHWEVRCGSFREAPDVVATWFVDPPYEGSVGDGYSFGSPLLDFAALGRWISARPGQVLACESGCATYLDFVPLRPGVDRPGDPHAEFVWPPAARYGERSDPEPPG